MDETVVVWFRKDLRVEDNLALSAAIKLGKNVLPVYIWSPEEECPWKPGGASQWWLHYALKSLDETLKLYGLRLILRQGDSFEQLQLLIQETRAQAVYWNRRFEPVIIQRDIKIKQKLSELGLEAKSFNSSLLYEPEIIKNSSKKPFQVFTPFWRHCLKSQWRPLEYVPLMDVSIPRKWPKSVSLEDFNLLPKIHWDKGFYDVWDPTLIGAKNRLDVFINTICADYKNNRDFPSLDGTSKLSPYLHFGQLSPHQIAQKIPQGLGGDCFLSELGWREFGYHLLYHFPETPQLALRKEFREFPWTENKEQLKAWQEGRTGHPIIDAGMRQLYQEGWMHNRVRMIVGSFLVKHLLHSWQEGAQWFWDTLVDADLASNTLGWQWVGGCGADAAPYFRVFNPILQGKKFDEKGLYVRKYVPELKKCPISLIHEPWLASEKFEDYPRTPIIEHEAGRARALAAYERFKTFRG